ncbi:MAG: addiction module toxin RelE [Planctomycetota bacterium]|nr:addiction module toxin RelE [Planctomycetota bacterium]
MKREFIESSQVREAFKANGVSDEQNREMEKQIMQGYGAIVPGTGGVKKIRCGASGRGKRGGVRVLFADYPRFGVTYLLSALGKGERVDFSREELKVIKHLKQQLDKMHGS